MSLLTVTYDNRDLIESSSTDNFTLVTKDKMMKDNINISLNAIARSAADITISDNTVTIPAGYYAEEVTKTINA